MADMGSKPVEPVLEDGMSGECVCLQNMVVANGYSSLATILHVWQSVKVNIAICPCLGQLFWHQVSKYFLPILTIPKVHHYFAILCWAAKLNILFFWKEKKQDFKNIAQMDSNFEKADLLCPAKHQPPLLLKWAANICFDLLFLFFISFEFDQQVHFCKRN